MTPRLQTCAIALVLGTLIGCDDPADPEEFVPLDALAIDVDVPDSVQASDSFDVAVTISNGEVSLDTRSLVLSVGISRDAASPLYLADFIDVAAIPAGESRDTTLRLAIPAAVAGLGGMNELVVRVVDDEAPGGVSVTQAFHVSPDIGALCDPETIAPVLTAHTDAFACDVGGEAVSVFAIDADPDATYFFEATNASWGIGIFTLDGNELLTRGSTPDGNFFFVEEAGLYYVVVHPIGGGFDFTLGAQMDPQ